MASVQTRKNPPGIIVRNLAISRSRDTNANAVSVEHYFEKHNKNISKAIWSLKTNRRIIFVIVYFAKWNRNIWMV